MAATIALASAAPSVPLITQVTTKVSPFVEQGMRIVNSPAFQALSSFGMCGLGANELVMGCLDRRPAAPVQPQNNTPLIRRITAAFFALFPYIHGGIIMGAGLAGFLACLPALQLANFSLGAVLALQNTSNGLFLLGNIYGLIYAVKEFQESFGLPLNASIQQHADAKYQKRSAILRIINTLCYVLSGAMYMLGVATGAAIVLGCLAAATSGIKIVYDFAHHL